MVIRDRAALALDKTHYKTMVGIRTEQARYILAAYLDGVVKLKGSTVRTLCKYLEMIAR